MDSLMDSRLVNYATVAIGLGLVIFIHELGHFLLAKWNGVKVELFAIGFGPPLVAWRKGIGFRVGSTAPEYEKRLAEKPGDPSVGETEYSIRAIPLGGFVKMLGEGETPEAMAEKSTDPRAYPNKSVWGRMQIISAGVIMNVILGLICFAVAYGWGGLPVVPARIGGVVAGHPAYVAGLQTGDTVTGIDGRSNIDFIVLQRVTAMSGLDQVLHLNVDRPGQEKPLAINVKPERQADQQFKTIGILRPLGLQLASRPYRTPAGLKPQADLERGLKDGDRVVGIGPASGTIEPVQDAFALNDRLVALRNEAVVLEVEGPGEGKSRGTKSRRKVTLPPAPFVDFGIGFEMGPIVAIQPGSPAERAGLKVGDRIVGLDSIAMLDPIRFPDEVLGRAGKSIALKVARGASGASEENLTVELTPLPRSSWIEQIVPNEPMDVPALGLAYEVVPRARLVPKESPAARAGLKAGDRITAVTLTFPAEDGAPEEPLALKLDGKEGTWPAVFALMQTLPRHPVKLQIEGRTDPIELTPQPASDWNLPGKGLRLDIDREPMPALGIVPAMRRGMEDTYDTILSVYMTFRSLFLGLISPKALGGPIAIAGTASQMARAGMVAFLQFLGMLSLNLAVINFLPIPPLDGGQMLFLIAEKLRGRPLPERALNAGTLVGLVFVLGLMVFALFQDILRLFE